MLKSQPRSLRQIAAVLSIVALLTAIAGAVRALSRADRRVFAEVSVDPQGLKEFAGLDPDFVFDVEREAGFITSPAILETALKRPEIANLELVKQLRNSAAARLGRRIRVEIPEPGVLRIYYLGERSFEAVRFINAIAATYIDEMLDETFRLRTERIELLERGGRDATSRVAEKRAAIGRLEALLAIAGKSTSSEEETNPNESWTQELDALRIAVEQGEEMQVRINAELAKLRIEPHGTAVRLHRAAKL